ncbi:MAG: hypothetical protein IJE07_08965 [Clostridia bacterium]|nr:hypothetical protein [Clostridia bacterium]
MICPYCQGEMQRGEISADPRGGLFFEPEGKKRTFGDVLCGVGRIEAARGGWSRLRVTADYCHQCKKMIFDTTIAK